MTPRQLGEGLSRYGTIVKTISRNLRRKKFESEVSALGQFVHEGSVCVDVGSGYGRYAFVLSGLCGASGHVYCFEPGAYSLSVLSAVTCFHGLKNVEVCRQALSSKSGEARLVVPVKNGGKIAPSLAHLASGVDTADRGQNAVAVTTLDAFLAKKRPARVDFIKCDVEGAELAVFEGSADTLARFRPAVLCEIYRGHLEKFGATPAQLFNFFRHRGYRAALYEDGKLTTKDAFDKDHNYFFIPISTQAT